MGRWIVTMALLAASAAAGCGDDDGGGSSIPDDPIPAAELCTKYLDGLCDANQRCCTTPTYASKETCIAENTAECQSSLGTLAMDARTGYDPAAAGELLSDLGRFTVDCDPSVATAADFESFFRGTVPEGGDCSLTSLMDLAPALSCLAPLACALRASGTMLVGTCQQKVGTGAECLNTAECQDTLRCDRGPGEMMGSCTPRLALGSPCEDDEDCQGNQCVESVCVAATQETVYCGIGDDGMPMM